MQKYYTDVQVDFIKKFPKIDRGFFSQDDENIYLSYSTENYIATMHVIPKSAFILDYERLKSMWSEMSMDGIRSIIMVGSDFLFADRVGTRLYKARNNREKDTVCTVLENEKHTVYVDNRLLKLFPKDARFYTSGAKTAVRVYIDEPEEHTFLGIVMPFHRG